MGLLRKAVHAATRGIDASVEAPVSPPRRMYGPTAPPGRGRTARSGLLRKSLDILLGAGSRLPMGVSLGNARETRSPEQTTLAITSAIQALPDDVELPALLFSALASLLAIDKGALLLFDPLRLVYAPWASHGYDQTTLHRMRIPLGANQSFNALANGSPIAISDAQTVSLYKQYFSAREFSTTTRLLLTPFIADEKLIGVLLVTALKPPFKDEGTLLQCLKSVAEYGSPRVQKSREKKLKKAGAPVMPAGVSSEEEAARYISSFGSAGTKILFLSLSLLEYSRKIVSAHAHLDPFRLHEDLYYFLGAFVADLGTAIQVRQGLFIVALQGFDAADLDLFLHQLSSFLHALFGGNGQTAASTGPKILKIRHWPEDGGDVRELVDFLSS